ncbi:hypothetical protein GPECTOR_3g160 [Gonium pectorale]|uniref:PHD-type domain-containing protein n=1 Tax=Gonium pectorale TaxID=33097 RepID=A0A150GYL7_GONPE|nr:hypothetical protein GPECTOR_3g160 [Gonium pectorale]|eukprot:KXZ54996.1 hypothetical protein GPECTOR_3g160 [Gonium pectorale]
MPVHDEVLRVERVGPLGVVVLIGRDGVRLRRRIEQLVPCHLPDIDPIVDPRLQRPASDYPCKVCGSPDDGPRMLLCDACGTGWHMLCLVPQLSAVPSGQWVCPKCVELRREAPEGPAPARPAPAAVLFPNTATRRRDKEAADLHGKRVLRVGYVGRGREKERVEYWGELMFRGPLERPRYSWLEWDGGAAESISLVEAKKMLADMEALRSPKRG